MGMKGLARLRAFTRISPAAVLAAAIAAAAAGALTVVPVAPGAAVSDSTPFTYMGTNPCNGEDFIGAGTLHMVMSENVSATGGLISHIDFSIDGLHAVTLDGKKYVVQDVVHDSLTFTGADEQTSDMTVHYVRQGDDGTLILGDDFYEYLRTHITVSASGVPSSHVTTNDAGVCQ